jgi:hypothetical protein
MYSITLQLLCNFHDYITLRLEDRVGMAQNIVLEPDDPRRISAVLAPVPPPHTHEIVAEQRSLFVTAESLQVLFLSDATSGAEHAYPCAAPDATPVFFVIMFGKVNSQFHIRHIVCLVKNIF